ncbi:MAG: hypothetical protein CMP36_00280 [Rickettsiales bacterium]|nr:hypothetical protein [Rickettsiales bacterium]OUV83498.1 MAG: hypothetical protein CBC91_00515 [Rickettsiales bacterium TMED131]
MGGEEISSLDIYRGFNKCPNCKIGKVFKGIIKLKSKCNECNLNFNAEKIGDGASWITTFFICFIVVPVLFFVEINFGIHTYIYLTIVLPLILLLSILLLRIFRYILIKRYYKLA